MTGPRVAVLARLEELGGHRSADEIATALADAGVRHTRSSVFNVLRDLVEHGLAAMADVGPGRTLYEPAGAWHHHFVCRECGVVVDVACVRGRKPCLRPDLDGIDVDEAQVIFRGLCEACSD